MAQYKGKVAWFNNAKGYGFITDESGVDVFVHYSAIKMDGYHELKEGEPVEFDLAIGPTGKSQAENVVRLTPRKPAIALENSIGAAGDTAVEST